MKRIGIGRRSGIGSGSGSAWIIVALVLAVVASAGGGPRSAAQEPTPGAATNGLLTQVAEAQDDEDDVHAALATAVASERAAMATVVSEGENQLATAVREGEDRLATAEATNAALASEVAALETEVAELEAGGVTMPAGVVEVDMNEVAQAGAWEITVTGVQRADAIESATAGEPPTEAQGEFLLVELEIVNAGTDTQTYDPTWFQVSDERGRNWPFDFTQTDTLALADAGIRQYAAVEPGLPQTAVVVFDIAPDATGLRLETVPADELEFTNAPQPAPFIIHLDEGEGE